jgi:chemotaxis methyl-accepting protein methylase
VSQVPADPEAFLALTEKIARERGFGTAGYKRSVLRRRIAVRMRARGAHDYLEYGHLLDGDPAEYQRLIDTLTINVTGLFRNPEAWSVVERTVLPALWAPAAAPIACWIAGCASGEEAYSLAALWHRFALAHGGAGQLGRVSIAATDIDRESLAAADRGSYPAEAFTSMPPDLRARYFASAPPFTVAPELRALVRFERRDLLLDPAPASGLRLIMCRNVIIYFNRPSQDALMQRFHDALAPGGFLVLGKVETLLGPARDLFEVVDQRQRIFRRR